MLLLREMALTFLKHYFVNGSFVSLRYFTRLAKVFVCSRMILHTHTVFNFKRVNVQYGYVLTHNLEFESLPGF